LILSFSLDAALRQLKPQQRTACPPSRPDEQLPWAKDAPAIAGPLLLDTTVYIDLLQGATPPEVDRLLQFRTCNHSAVSLAELTHAFGRLDPAHPDTKVVLRELRETITEDIPPHRLHAPEDDTWGTAGILAGLAFRLRKLPKNQGHERKFLHDALLYLHARKLGCAVLTRNIGDFDLLNQLVPGGHILLYRQASA
jgi:predicted nucleic acid-binding protein